MVLQHQISITADSGVGSTTTAKCLHARLGISPWRWVNAGGIMRLFAEEAHMTIEEFAVHNATHPEEKTDERCDGMVSYFAQQDYVIFEGRLVHHFAPDAYHVRLVCDPKVRAQRRMKDFPGVSLEDMETMIGTRDTNNIARYTKVYGPHVLWQDEKFDLVLDTGVLNPEEVADAILEGHKKWIEGKV